MTTHGRSGLGRLLFGSVAQAVVKRADVPVLLLRLGAAAAARRAA
jgi:nucleotide-binding universal stress UspA family protein